MEKGDWNKINSKLGMDIKHIFNGYDIDILSDFEKRKIIFEYLSNNISYDFELLDAIREFHINRTPVARDSYLELDSVIFESKGICNGISQYYKLLLEKIGVKSICVICDDGTPVKHQLTLVYNEETDSYSFDDVVSVIVGRGTIDDYFDYDMQTANLHNQGNRFVHNDKKWFILPDSFIYFLIGRDIKNAINIEDMPENIRSVSSGTSFKF